MRHVDDGGDALAGNGHGGPVGRGCQPAGTADGFGQRHGNVVDGLQAGGFYLAVDINAAGAVSLDPQGDLRVFEKFRQAADEFFTRLVFSQPGNVEGAEQRKLDQSVGADVVAVADRRETRGIGRQCGTGRSQHQFRVVPDNDVDDIARTNSVDAGFGKQAFDVIAQLGPLQHTLPADQLGRDGQQRTGRRRLPRAGACRLWLAAGFFNTPADRQPGRKSATSQPHRRQGHSRQAHTRKQES